MGFKITARTILQLGAELISSDAIAFYELIKNSFDAESPTVSVRIVKRFPKQKLEDYILQCKDGIEESERDLLNASVDEKASHHKKLLDDFDNLKIDVLKDVDKESFQFDVFASKLEKSSTFSDLLSALKKANYILISDKGLGMSLSDLDNVYLTIGTRSRRSQKLLGLNDGRPILGEKGLGRLSVMRLGNGLKVETTQVNDTRYNLLEIDWDLFSHDSDALLESIDISPIRGRVKQDPNEQGTKIFVYDLVADWAPADLIEIGKNQLSRFIDPYQSGNRGFIQLWFNKEPIPLSGIEKDVFNYAHAVVNATLEFDEENLPCLSGRIRYRVYNREKTFSLNGVHLKSVIGDKIDLSNLGPFSMEFFWYNRKLLAESEILDKDRILNAVKSWAGGLTLYRDGFRVNPYGSHNDDWLEIDRIALSSPGYKLNRRQIIGKVDISSVYNPRLVDQTNREGLRDNPEKNALVSLLQYIIWKEVKIFLDEVVAEEKKNLAALSVKDIEKRIAVGKNKVTQALQSLMTKYPEISEEKEIIATIEDVLKESVELFQITKESSNAIEDRLKTTLELAGLGLMVDVIAHELHRTTEHALSTLNNAQNISESLQPLINTLKTQLKTLKTRLKVLDPLGPSGRQRKEMTNLTRLVEEILGSHDSQFSRHNITFEFSHDNDEWNVKVVPGMIVQILENLISNSVYWIKQLVIVDKTFQGKITVTLHRKEGKILFSDNGPGIPREKSAEVFRPFYSTKPPGAGKGLGLYISRETAQYNGAKLSLIDDGSSHFNTFLLTI